MLSLILAALLQQAAPASTESDGLSAPPEAEADGAAPAAQAAAEAPADPAPAPLMLPKTTPLIIAIDKELGSKISQAGEMFPIRLARPVVIDGHEVLPAGIVGEGQVVHAKKAGIAGSAGELILAARYLDHGGRRIQLRSFRFLEAGDIALAKGQDNISEVNAAMWILSPFAFFIGGGNTNVPPGTVASAKTRNQEIFDRPAAAGQTTEVQHEEAFE